MKTFNGHRSWNAWNISLWMNNDEMTYSAVCSTIARFRKAKPNAKPDKLAGLVTRSLFHNGVVAGKTPDGAVYNRISVKAVVSGLIDDMFTYETEIKGNK